VDTAISKPATAGPATVINCPDDEATADARTYWSAGTIVARSDRCAGEPNE